MSKYIKPVLSDSVMIFGIIFNLLNCALLWRYPIALLLFVLLFVIPVFLLYSCLLWKYVVITDCELVVIPYFYRFHPLKYQFADIGTIELNDNPTLYLNAYMKVTILDGRSKKIFLESVKSRDYHRIVNELRSHGVTVKTSGLEKYEPET